MMRLMRGLLIGLILGWWLALRWKRQDFALTPATQEILVRSWKELHGPLPAVQGLQRSATAALADRLEEIRGIGPVFANRLAKAGITTYSALAGADPERLLEIVSSGGRPVVNVEEWIEEARQLAKGTA